MRRWVLAFGVLITLSASAAIFLLVRFDGARVRADLVRVVFERTGRTLDIDGDVSLSLFPVVALRSRAVRLSEPGVADRTFAALDHARVAVRLLPLLSGRIEAERIELDGLKINLRRDSHGRLNIADLFGFPQDPALAPGAGASQLGSLPRFEIAGVTIRNAMVNYFQASERTPLVLAEIDLYTDRLANRADGQLTLGGMIRQSSDPLRGVLTAHYHLDLDQQSFTLELVTLELNGPMAALRNTNARLHFDTVSFTAGALSLKGGGLQVQGHLAGGHVAVNAMFPEATVNAGGEAAVPVLKASVEVDLPTLANRPTTLTLEERELVVSSKGAAGLTTIRLDETALDLDWRVPAFEPLAVRFAARLNQLDADRYFLPMNQAARTVVGAPRPSLSGDPALDFSVLRGVDVRGTITAAKLRARRMTITDMQAEAWLHHGRLDIPEFFARIYGGELRAQASLDSHGNQLVLKPVIANADLGALLTDLVGKSVLQGRGHLSAELNTRGESTGDWRRRLAGEIRAQVRDGAFSGINLAQSLRSLKARFARGESVEQTPEATQRTDFSSLSASFRIAEGIAENDDLDGRLPLFRLTGAGRVDLGRERVDYLAHAAIVNTATGQDGKDLAYLRGVRIPIRLIGPYAQLQWRIEFADLASAAIRGKVRKHVQESFPRSAGTLGNRLKGLFGR